MYPQIDQTLESIEQDLRTAYCDTIDIVASDGVVPIHRGKLVPACPQFLDITVQ
ncbi:Hypothetical protein D9617_14g077510 [Elsinoe fawcettii]|nr:Hypothetical protein D9617_14g077510 [Elsinoe fawcettii]